MEEKWLATVYLISTIACAVFYCDNLYFYNKRKLIKNNYLKIYFYDIWNSFKALL